ncbi:DUF6773 family protein [Anaerotignum sp. MB30-C6]|uniref:DUF6773 family protein n=1 Tax=Anaerotignum sp. MB30-C6 TaxID=3070814 RepID=UPI0027DDE733|nr:DUF6773 family protein [Anaerotignum sp. MB30-C6]WMI81210.1 hypothetical protein RBQ60_00325 [Anaerotignum sp. MB30-C6]
MKIKDERVEQTKNKIGTELMQLMYLFIVLSFVVKGLYFKMDLSQCLTEYVILIATPIYQMVRSHQLGVVFSTHPKEQMTLKKNIISAIVGIVVFYFFWLSSGKQVSKEFAVGYITTYLLLFFLIRIAVVRMEERRKEKLEKEYED